MLSCSCLLTDFFYTRTTVRFLWWLSLLCFFFLQLCYLWESGWPWGNPGCLCTVYSEFMFSMLSACRTQGPTYLGSQVLVHLCPLSSQFWYGELWEQVAFGWLLFIDVGWLFQWLRVHPDCVEVVQLFIQFIFKIYLPSIKLIYTFLTSSPSHLYRHLCSSLPVHLNTEDDGCRNTETSGLSSLIG